METFWGSDVMDGFSQEELAKFERDGFILLPGLAPPDLLSRLIEQAERLAADPQPPVEFEAAVGYPGAPATLEEPGGKTIRRVRKVVGRHPAFMEWASHPCVASRLRQLLGPDLVVPLAHHNCIMFKDPKFSSDTGWHQDVRYWRFQRPELVSVLLALDPSNPQTGSLKFIPGTHRMTFAPDRLDAESFLIEDHPANKALLDTVVETSVQPGDVVFFHCRTFHAASRNRTAQYRRSLILTYAALDNRPLPGTRSAEGPELLLRS